MLKLIASDVDGTLLQNGASAISEQLFSCINRLSDRGALFAVCSGRAYHDLRTMFAPVSDHVIFVSHDGALVMYKERALMKLPVDPSAAKLFCSKAAAEKQCSVFVSGKYISYFQPESSEFSNMVRKNFHNHVVQIRELSEIHEDIYKLSVFSEQGLNDELPFLNSYDKTQLRLAYRDKQWREFVAAGVNKGSALAWVQRCFGIEKNETAAFGDNYNDLEMFDYAAFDYAVTNAKPEVLARCAYRTESVESTLEKWLSRRE